MYDLFGASIRYSYTDKTWMYYDGRRWKVDDTGETKRMVDEMLDFMKSPEQNDIVFRGMREVKEYRKHIKTSRSSKAKQQR